MAFHPNQQLRLLEQGFDPLQMLQQSLTKKAPWESIVDFATHEDFCNQSLYPRQATLLKLIFLETENFTAYDLEVIEEWRVGFQRHRQVYGIQPDIWERIDYLKHRGYRRFPHIQAVLGRRASKGFIGAILAAEQMAYLISLDNPQAYYSIREGKDVFLNVGATSQTQAQRFQFADIRDVVEGCRFLQPYIVESKDHQMRLRTPADLRRIASLRAQGVPLDHAVATIWAVALSASSVSGRGATSFANFFDEFAHHIQGTNSSKSSDNIYEDWQPSLGQFKKDALTYVPSSPFTMTGKFYELYQQGKILLNSYVDTSGMGEEAAAALAAMRMKADMDEVELAADPTMLIFQGPSWALYEDWERGPELVQVLFDAAPEDDLTSEEQQRRKLKNPEKFSVEREGQFAEVLGQYLDPGKVEAMFKPVPWREPSILEPTEFGRFDYTYRMHCDPSKSGANFALAIAHTELAPPDAWGQRWPHVIIDKLHVWKAADFPIDAQTGKREIDYIEVERELDRLLYTFPSISRFSSDQWNSIGFLQRLRKKYMPKIQVTEETATEKSNYVRAERFKNALGLGWVHSYRDGLTTPDQGTDSLLEAECKFLSEKNGKVYKQEFGPVTTKDLYDAVSVVVTDLLAEALERWDGPTLNARSYGTTNDRVLRSDQPIPTMEPTRSGPGAYGDLYNNGTQGDLGGWEALRAQQGDRAGQRAGVARGDYSGANRLRNINSRPTRRY